MSKRTTIQSLSVSLAAVLLVAACASQQPTPTPPAPIPFKLVVVPYLSYATFHIGLQEGYFAEQGLDVETVQFQTAEDAISTLLAGEVDAVGGLTSVGVLNAIARGGNIKIVADRGHTPVSGCDTMPAIARPSLVEDGTITDVASLRGLAIGTEPGSFVGFMTDKLLALGNLTMDDVTIVDLPSYMWQEALKQGSVDLFAMANEPWATRILLAGDAQLWMRAQDYAPGHQFALVLFGPTLLGENREAGKRFMVAYLKALRKYREGKTERNLDILTSALGLERELLEAACWPPVSGHGRINIESVLEFQDWALERGLVDTPVTADQLYDSSFIEYANEVLGPE